MDSPSRPNDAQRWLRFKNVASETIPPFAVVGPQLDRDDTFDAVETSSDLDFALRLGRPHAAAPRGQDASLFYINGSQEIAPNRLGRCTQTGMMQALIGYESDKPPTWGESLAIDTSQAKAPFYLVPGAGAYKFIDFDGCPRTTFKDPTRTGSTFRVGWVVPASNTFGAGGLRIVDDVPLVTLASGEVMKSDTLDEVDYVSYGYQNDRRFELTDTDFVQARQRGFYRIDVPGIYLLTLSASIRSTDVPVHGNYIEEGTGSYTPKIVARTTRVDRSTSTIPPTQEAVDGLLNASGGFYFDAYSSPHRFNTLLLHTPEQAADTHKEDGEIVVNRRLWHSVSGSDVFEFAAGDYFFIYNPTPYEIEVSCLSGNLTLLQGASRIASPSSSSFISGSTREPSEESSGSSTDTTELSGRVTTVEAEVNSLASDIESLETTVTSQGTTITSHATTIAAHTTEIAANASVISTNTASISAAVGEISEQETRIADLETFETSVTASLAAHASAISVNVTDIATNAAAIANHASAIGDLETFETTATANIATNASDIDSLESFQATTEAIFAAAIADGTITTAAGDEIATTNGVVTAFTPGPISLPATAGANTYFLQTNGLGQTAWAKVVHQNWSESGSGHLVPDTNNIRDIGTSSIKPRNLYLAGNATVDGSLTVGGADVITSLASIASSAATNAGNIDDLEAVFAGAISDGTYTTAAGDQVTTTSGIVTAFTPGGGANGFKISNNSSDAHHDLDIAAGACRSWDRTTWIEGTAMTKRFDAAWSAGSGNGGIDSGSMPTSGGLYLYAIYHPSNGVDYIGSTTAPAAGPSLPTGYTKYAYLGYRPTDSSANFYQVIQTGTHHEIYPVIQFYSASNPGSSSIDHTVPAPAHAKAQLWSVLSSASSTRYLWLGSTSITPTVNSPTGNYHQGISAGDGDRMTLDHVLDASSQVRTRLTGSDAGLFQGLALQGWEDLLMDRRLGL